MVLSALPNVFLLNGSATLPAGATPPPDDWSSIIPADHATLGYSGTQNPSGRPLAVSFIDDMETAALNPPSGDLTYFQGGGSKDVNEISQWAWGPNDVVPDKNTIDNAYAAAYSNPTDGHLDVYFGADRFANNGSAQMGFWFFQDTVTPVGSGSGGFSGTHKVGDLLVLTNFTTGGSVANVQVLEWVGGANPLFSLYNSTTVDPSNGVYAVTNSGLNGLPGATPAPWLYTAKTPAPGATVNPNGTTNLFPTFSFFEGGIDVTQLFLNQNQPLPCFSSFLAETRSSGSATTAQLKDFALGSFELCDARISIKPPTATNEVGTPHTLTVEVDEQDPLSGYTMKPAPNETVTVTLANTNGATSIFVGGGTITNGGHTLTGTTDASGLLHPVISSPTPGQTTITATSDVKLSDGDVLTRTTGDGISGDSGPAQKTWVDANISISPSATNEVNHPHTFTVYVTQNLGDGKGYVAAASEPVTVTLKDTNGATTTPLTYNLTTDNTGHASVTFTSATAGQVIGNASTSFTVGGVLLTRATGDTHAGDSGPATKTFVDAKISISPSATNGITEPHTFTVTVMQNLGDGKGFVAAVGKTVTVTLAGSGGAVPILQSGSLTGTTNGSGQFQVTFTSDTAGQVTGNASTTFAVGGVNLTRATGDSHTGDGPAATKTFVAGSLKWKKVDGSGTPLGGATFLVTATSGTAATTGHTPLSVSVLDNTGQAGYSGPDADPRAGYFQLNTFQSFAGSALGGLAMGTYTIKETTAPTGYNLDPNTQTATLTIAAPNADRTSTPFVDTKPDLNIHKAVTPGYSAVIHPGDYASFTITVSNDGDGYASNVVLTDPLPEHELLPWTITASTFDTASIDANGVLKATSTTLPAHSSEYVIVSAKVPSTIFGNPPGTGNNDPLPLNLFQLDGNATLDAGAPGDDWQNALRQVGGDGGSSTASSWVHDPVNSQTDDIFTGGGSKDTLDIPTGPWLWKNGKPQAKDDIADAFAALYTDPVTNDVILYAGLDRYDNSGDATAGFWFFQNPVTTKGTSQGGGTTFTGSHADGDILLVSDFTIGGSFSTVTVYRWTVTNGVGSLVKRADVPNTTKAEVNSGPIPVYWNFKDKSGSSQPLQGEFLEEGVNLTALGLGGCFSNFMAETRSSQSPTATLSDFVIGNFNTCNLVLSNTASVEADILGPPKVHIGPKSSETVIITINDGDQMSAGSAASLGGGSTLAAPGSVAHRAGSTLQDTVGGGAGALAPAVASGMGTTATAVNAVDRLLMGDLSSLLPTTPKKKASFWAS